MKDNVGKQFNVISRLLRKTDEVVIATDADREGEIIARNCWIIVVIPALCAVSGCPHWMRAVSGRRWAEYCPERRPRSYMKPVRDAAGLTG